MVKLKPLRLNGMSYNGNLNIGNLEDVNMDEDETLNIIYKILVGNGISCSCVKIIKGIIESRYFFELSDYSITYDKIKGMENTLRLYLKSKSIIVDLNEEIVGFVIIIPASMREIVPFANIMEYSPSYPCKTFENPINIALGVDSDNNPVFVNIDEYPHILISGNIDSGKSTCMHTIIASLLFSCYANMVNLVLIDTKQIEFSKYDGMKYYLNDNAVTRKNDDAVDMLYKVCAEMDWRYSKFTEMGVNNIVSYNLKKPIAETFNKIVVIIDELGELLSFNGKAVKELLGKIYQYGKSAGIYLIIGTSNPSCSKSINFNTKICFSVVSEEHSKIVLGEKGAEKLIGKGDGILKQGNNIIHFQGCYLTERDIDMVINFVNTKSVVPKDESSSCADSLQEKLENYKELLND